jgi:DNA-binding ferritin-like protein
MDLQKPQPLIIGLLGFLWALRLHYQMQHWFSKDVQSHELYGRMYEELEDPLDSLAEKLVSLGTSFNISQQGMFQSIVTCSKYVQTISQGPSSKTRTRALLDQIQASISLVHEDLTQQNTLTLGMDDTLQSLSSLLDSHIYLTQLFS